MPEHYDVIIIGSGAGGGTLAHTLAAVGQADPAARTRQLPAPRDGELGSGAGVRRRPVHLDRHVVRRRRQAVPAAGPLLRRRRDQALRRRALPAAPAGLRRAQARRRRLARVAARATTTSSPGTRRPSGSTRCTATTARTRPRGTGASSTRGRPVSHEPRIQEIVRRPRRPAATTRSTRRAASCSTRRTGRRARASAARGATATRASCTPSPTPRRSRCGRSSTCPNVTLLVDAEVVEARDRRRRPDA